MILARLHRTHQQQTGWSGRFELATWTPMTPRTCCIEPLAYCTRWQQAAIKLSLSSGCQWHPSRTVFADSTGALFVAETCGCMHETQQLLQRFNPAMACGITSALHGAQRRAQLRFVWMLRSKCPVSVLGQQQHRSLVPAAVSRLVNKPQRRTQTAHASLNGTRMKATCLMCPCGKAYCQ